MTNELYTIVINPQLSERPAEVEPLLDDLQVADAN
jgi:hypothetical protein